MPITALGSSADRNRTCPVCADDMPGADELTMRVYAAMAQKQRELISERSRVALGAAKARGVRLGGDRGYRFVRGPRRGCGGGGRSCVC